MDRRRLLLIAAFITSVIIVAIMLYLFFFRDLFGPAGPGATNGPAAGNFPSIGNGNISVLNTNNTNGGLPRPGGNLIDINAPSDVAHGGLTNVKDVSTIPAKDFISSPNGALFYDQQSGLFLKLGDNGVVPLSDKKFFNVDNVTWYKNGDRAILEYPDGSNIFYDFTTNKQVTLPKELNEFSFDSTGTQIAGKWLGSKDTENWLMVGDTNGAGFQLIEPLGDQQANVQVSYSPDNQIVALVRKPIDAGTQEILPIGLHGENFDSFNVDGLKFESTWAPTGNTLLYNISTAANDYKPELWLTSGTTDTLGTTQLNLKLNTWADKCTFNSSATSIYCAEPTSLPNGAGLYPELGQGSADTMYRIDLKSGLKVPLAIPVGSQASYSASSLHLSSDESILYFTDAVTNQIHAIRLR